VSSLITICTNRTKRPQTADNIHAWITRTIPEGPHPRIVRPFNYIKFISITTAAVGILTFLTVAAPYVLPLLQNRNLWAAVSLIAVLLFTSGHMFNHIRKVPYVSGDGKGGISYFAGGFQNQFGLETQIIAAICQYSSSVDPKTEQGSLLTM
jgi:oligosaccharyltransferase complex subunit gamma